VVCRIMYANEMMVCVLITIEFEMVMKSG
jgi:hypothetical protein